MVTTSLAWKWLGAAVVVSACGGDPFVLGDASAVDAQFAGRDGNSEALAPTGKIFCADQTCNAGQNCCTSASSPSSSNCRDTACNGCNTVLTCSSEANCPGQFCCARVTIDGNCSGGYRYGASCQPTCPVAQRLCDPNGQGCSGGRNCSTSSNALALVGLPPSYGVCSTQ
ncbi:MAG: hypothetical protein M3O46_04800 [Myxococcota bacterium]|nr:hypothetical protein [Myxococcota bacterium]